MRTLYFAAAVVSIFFFLSSFSSPNLSGRRLDVYHPSTHGVALVRIKNAGLKCAAGGSLEIQDAKNRQKFAVCASSHNFVSSYIFATKACIDNRKNLLNSNISSTCSHNMVNFGALAADIDWRVLGTHAANFNGFRVLAALLQRRRSTEVNQTLHDVWPSPGLVRYICIFAGGSYVP